MRGGEGDGGANGDVSWRGRPKPSARRVACRPGPSTAGGSGGGCAGERGRGGASAMRSWRWSRNISGSGPVKPRSRATASVARHKWAEICRFFLAACEAVRVSRQAAVYSEHLLVIEGPNLHPGDHPSGNPGHRAGGAAHPSTHSMRWTRRRPSRASIAGENARRPESRSATCWGEISTERAHAAWEPAAAQAARRMVIGSGSGLSMAAVYTRVSRRAMHTQHCGYAVMALVSIRASAYIGGVPRRCPGFRETNDGRHFLPHRTPQ